MLERGDRRVLDELLGQVPVAEDADEGGGQAAALVAQDLGEPRVDDRSVNHNDAR